MKYILFCILALFAINSTALSSDEDISKYLRMVTEGRINDVKTKLPDLLAANPSDPGVMLLHGVVIDDAFTAVKIYKRIVLSYPNSRWADDAYWRIIQFYSVLGDTTQARINFHKFRQKYPDSEYVGPAADVVRSAVALAKSGKQFIDAQAKAKSGIAYMEEEMIDPSEEIEETPVKTNYTEEKITKIPTKEAETLKDNSYEQPKVEKKVDLTPKKTLQEKTVSNDKVVNLDKDPNAAPTYGLQVGIFTTKDNAEAEMKKFLRQRMRTQILEKVVDDTVLYAVVIGNYSSEESAEAAKYIVQQQCNCTPIVFKK